MKRGGKERGSRGQRLAAAGNVSCSGITPVTGKAIRRWEAWCHAGRCRPFGSPALAARHGARGYGAGLTAGDDPARAADPSSSRRRNEQPSADRARPIVAVDAMGGDNAPDEIVAGAVAAVRQHGIQVVLAGRPGQLRPLLADHHATGEIRIVAADDSPGMDEGGLASWRRPRSSIAVRLPAGPARAGLRGGIRRLDRRHRDHRADAAAAAARCAAARARGRAAEPADPDHPAGRRRDRRSQARDARPVRPARGGLRADLRIASPSPGWAC